MKTRISVQRTIVFTMFALSAVAAITAWGLDTATPAVYAVLLGVPLFSVFLLRLSEAGRRRARAIRTRSDRTN